MSLIAVHTPDVTKFPNLALMKLSAWHKQQGHGVEWYRPLFSGGYDAVYSSKVFTFSDDDPFLTSQAMRGGTGYGLYEDLPDEIEHIKPDYSLYPACDFSLGFLTRGCIRNCSWCVVPKKEGLIRKASCYDEFVRDDTNKIVFMDNNPLAHDHALSEMERLVGTRYRIDFNQGLDARLIAYDESIAELLAALRWIRFIRLACDTKKQMGAVETAVELLRKHGCSDSRFYCYVLVKDIDDALERVEFLKKINVEPFAQPYRDFENKTVPTVEQRRFARWVNHKAIFKSVEWHDYKAK